MSAIPYLMSLPVSSIAAWLTYELYTDYRLEKQCQAIRRRRAEESQQELRDLRIALLKKQLK